MSSIGGKELKAVVKLAGEVDPSLAKAVKQAAKDLKALDKVKPYQKLSKYLQKAGKTLIKGITVPAIAMGTIVTKLYSDFDDSMRQVQATMSATPREVEKLSAAAQKMGIETRYSAAEASEALNFLAQAGYDADQAIKALPSTLRLAQAGGLDLAYATELVTDSAAALGMGMDELDTFIDQMAIAANKSNTNIAQLGEAILTVGGTAKQLKGGTVELNAVLGILANRGMKGAEGGTMLRNIITSLSTPTEKASKRLKKLGVDIYDTEGNMRPLNDTFKDLTSQMAGMNDEQRNAVLGDVFNNRDLKAAEALLAGCGDEFDNLATDIYYSRGAAQKMADTMEGGVGGSFRSLRSATEGLGLAFGETLVPYIKKGTDWVTKITRGFTKMSPKAKDITVKIVAVGAALGPVLLVLGKLSGAVSSVLTAGSHIAPFFGNLVSALGPLAGPAGIAVIAAGAILGLGIALKKARNDAIQADLESRFGTLKLSIDDMRAIAETARTPFADACRYMLEQSEQVKEAYENLRAEDAELGVSIRKINLDTELSEETISDLKLQVGTYTKNVQDAIALEKATVTMSLEAFLKESGDPEANQRIIDQFTGYFDGLEKTASEKGAALRTAVDNALADGVISGEEQKTIDRLRSELSQIISQGTILDADIAMGTLAAKVRAGEFDLESIAGLKDEIQAAKVTALEEIQKGIDYQLGMNEALYGKGATTPIERDQNAALIREIGARQLKEQELAAAELQSLMVNGPMQRAFSDELASVAAFFNNLDYTKYVDEVRHEYLDGGMSDLSAFASDIEEQAVARFRDDMDRLLLGLDVSDQVGKMLEDLVGPDAIDYESLKRDYIALGKEIPEWVNEGAKLTKELGFLAKNKEYFAVDSEATQSIINYTRTETAPDKSSLTQPRQDTVVPEVTEKAAVIISSREKEHDKYFNEAAKNAANNLNSTEVPLKTLGDSASGASSNINSFSTILSRFRLPSFTDKQPGIKAVPYAEGGTLSRPTLALVAEAGVPETIVPHNNTPRSKALLLEAAQGIGLGTGGSKSSGSESKIEINAPFSPQVTVHGNGDEESIKNIILSLFPQFFEMLQDKIEEMGIDRERVSYGTV